MARNDVINRSNLTTSQTKVASEKGAKGLTDLTCSNCGGSLEQVGNRMFLMYKRARLPQPQPEAWVCVHCGWVEGDAHFQALLEERINHR